MRDSLLVMTSLMVASTISATAVAQESEATDPVLEQAASECEAGVTNPSEDTRALGACDYVIRSGDLGEEMRAVMHVNRAIMLTHLGDGRSALTDLDAADMLADQPEYQLNLSAAYIQVSQYDRAYNAAMRAFEAGLTNPAFALFNQAIALEGMDRYQEAYQRYMQAAELEPENPQMQAQPLRFRWHQVETGPGRTSPNQ